MNIKILDPIQNVVPHRDVFLVTATAMFGDADGEEQVVIDVFPNEAMGKEMLKECIQVCDRMMEAFPEGMGGADEYADVVEGYDVWIKHAWIMDPLSGGEYEAQFDGYEVTYFDKYGVEHAVEVSGK